MDILESRPSAEMPPSSGTPGVLSSMERRKKRKERDPMTSILDSLSTTLAESQPKHDLQMAELSARQKRECVQNLRLHEESWKIQMENSQIMMQMEQTTNMLLVAFMKMNPEILQALFAAIPSAPLMLGTVTSGSLLSGSSTGEEKAAQSVQREAGDHVPPAVVPPTVEDDTVTSSAMHHAPPEVTRAETA